MSANAVLKKEDTGDLSEISRRAYSLYEEKIKALVEPEQTGRGIAIHPKSGEYVVADTPTKAGHTMRQKHPQGEFVTLRIGAIPDYSLIARLLPDKNVHEVGK
jgi:hypothetical protein